MLCWTDGSSKMVELRIHELHARAEQARLVRQARSARPWPEPQHWRRRVGTVLAGLFRRPTGLGGPDIDQYGLEEIAP
jgi:hypothetical protein